MFNLLTSNTFTIILVYSVFILLVLPPIHLILSSFLPYLLSLCYLSINRPPVGERTFACWRTTVRQLMNDRSPTGGRLIGGDGMDKRLGGNQQKIGRKRTSLLFLSDADVLP
ncbi:hypothetical protein [Parabacteroides sp. AM08-6]|uniref:hypothetical protein n=1 Tax=Parabacteroides sp. AM08-6 TaxID=2292053 RepID=UPI0011C3A059|nr:hypothetical protein [Parabacteroides sp. AM08-6]